MAARKGITKEKYDRIVAALREHPDHPYTAARLAEADPRTVLRAWEKGWPRRGMPAVKGLFEEEQAKARAEMQAEIEAKRAMSQKEKEDMVAQAARARAEEGQLVTLNRASALQATAVAASLSTSARKLGQKIKEKLEELSELQVSDKNSPSASVGINLLERVTGLQARALRLARESMELERLHLGQPTNITQQLTDSEMTMEEAAARIESARKAIEGARRAGGLKVIDGGLKTPVVGKKVDSSDLLSQEEVGEVQEPNT